MVKNTDKRVNISFRWQTIGVILFVIMSGSAFLIFNATNVLKGQLTDFSEKQHELHHEAVELHLEQLKSSMLKTATLLTYTTDQTDTWFDFTIDPGFNILAHYDHNAKLLSFVNTGFNARHLSTTNIQKRLINLSLNSETALFALDCQDIQCVLNLAFPFYTKNDQSELLLLSLPLGQFFNKNSANLYQVLLKPARPSSVNTAWPFAIESLNTDSNAKNVLNLISQESQPAKFLKHPLLTQLEGRSYLVSSIELSDGFDTKLPVFFIEEFSDETLFIDETLQHYISIALGVTALTLLFLYFYFSPPFKRLDEISEILPQLAITEDPIPLVQQIDYRSHVFRDEFETIEDATVRLASTLDQLRKRVKRQQSKIQSQIESISAEKKYIEYLLDNIPTVVLTLDTFGRVVQYNDFARTHIKNISTIEKQPFEDLLLEETNKKLFSDFINNSTENLSYNLELESKLLNTESFYLWRMIQIEDVETHDVIYISIGVDISERYRYEMELYQFANFDALTGLHNRHAFFEEIHRIASQTNRRKGQFCLLYIDLNKFKQINDLAGHNYGDDMLTSVSQCFKEATRKSDFVARLGGDEFAIILPDTQTKGAYTVAQHIIERVSQVQIEFEKTVFVGSVSIGIAQYPTVNNNINDLINQADQAMYEAKQAKTTFINIAS